MVSDFEPENEVAINKMTSNFVKPENQKCLSAAKIRKQCGENSEIVASVR